MDGGGGGATIGKVQLEPVETAGGSGAFRSGFWVVQDRGFTTRRTGPVSKAGVVGCGGGVAVSVRVNSDEGESSREREKTHGREREKSLPSVYEFISEPPMQPNHPWPKNPSDKKMTKLPSPQGQFRKFT
ncbi:unnamed protein product [Prunus armeniaca]